MVVATTINRFTSSEHLGQYVPGSNHSMSKNNNSARHGASVVEQAKFIQQFSKMSVTQTNNHAAASQSNCGEIGSGITGGNNSTSVSSQAQNVGLVGQHKHSSEVVGTNMQARKEQ